MVASKYKLQVRQIYLTGSFESKTNIPMVSQILLFLTTLLVQEDCGLFLEGLLVLHGHGAKGYKQSINIPCTLNYIHNKTRHT